MNRVCATTILHAEAQLGAGRGWLRWCMDAMWRMVTADEPADFVIGTGVAHSVREFCELAFYHVGLDWERYVRHDDRYERPAEVENLVADASAAEAELGWKPTVDFASLVAMMVEADRAPYR